MNSILITLVLSCILVSGIFFINNNNNSFNHNILINANGQEEYYNDYNDYYYDDYDNRYNYLPQEQEYYEHNYYNNYSYKIGDSQETKLFAIHHVESGTISEINSNIFSLELNGVTDNTIIFSDTSYGIIKSISTEDFVDNWNLQKDRFGNVHLNGLLFFGKEKLESISIELFNPIYDADEKILQFDITIDDTTDIDLLNESDQATLVVDDWSCSSLLNLGDISVIGTE